MRKLLVIMMIWLEIYYSYGYMDVILRSLHHYVIEWNGGGERFITIFFCCYCDCSTFWTSGININKKEKFFSNPYSEQKKPNQTNQLIIVQTIHLRERETERPTDKRRIFSHTYTHMVFELNPIWSYSIKLLPKMYPCKSVCFFFTILFRRSSIPRIVCLLLL